MAQGKLELLTPQNCALVLIDHQPQMTFGVANIDRQLLKNNVIGLAKAANVERGFVTRVPKAYPMYDADYSDRVAVIKDWLSGITNLQQVGRNGLHRYNTSDHSMLTAMRAVDNVMTGSKHDLWSINAESAYHEEHQEPEQPYKRVPSTVYEREPLHTAEEAAA